MAQENIIKFDELLRSDEALQAKLKAAADAFEGDRTDEEAVFAAIIAPLAEEVGFPFTYEEGKSLAAGAHEINEADLGAVAGGLDGYCYVIGGSDGAIASDEYGKGGLICFYAGIGLFSA